MSEQPTNESATNKSSIRAEATAADKNQDHSNDSVADEQKPTNMDTNNSAGSQEQQLTELRQQLEAAESLANDQRDAALRAKAEGDNIRRRAERDVEQAHKFALEKFVTQLLPVLDSLEQGLQQPATSDESTALKEGMELTFKMFQDALAKKNVLTLDPVGEVFNPAEHEAMSMQENPDFKPNTVIAVFQKGYSLNGRIVRPARVVVNKGKAVSIDEKV